MIINKTHRLIIIFLPFVIFFTSSALYAQPKSFEESQIKAVFLYNLTNFISWPPGVFKSADPYFRICILGNDPFNGFLDKIVKGEKVDNKSIKIKKIKATNSLSECNILFINHSYVKKVKHLLGPGKLYKILTVSNYEDFAMDGGMVNLINKKGRVKIEINADLVSKAGFVISSKLLKIAAIVKANDPAENK